MQYFHTFVEARDLVKSALRPNARRLERLATFQTLTMGRVEL